jgi:hypothetical protein
MNYEIQKIILKNCTVYNILLESELLGHVIEEENKNLLIQTSDLNIIPIAESLGFNGSFICEINDNYEIIKLNSSGVVPVNFKVINLQEHFLNELDILI